MIHLCPKTLRTAARQMPLREHHPQHARLLRQAMAASGKTLVQHTAHELIALNHHIHQQLEAAHHAS